MDLVSYRKTDHEQLRIADLFTLIPDAGVSALDIGARDGYLSRRLAERFDSVTALDLARPAIDHPRITPVGGDVTRLEFPDQAFDVSLCAEVLEHIPPASLPLACAEIARVTRKAVIIGVPYLQDLRSGRTTCRACGRTNPPWGHVNRFDEATLRSLFPALHWTRANYVGTSRAETNPVSTWLLNFAGNPFGTYDQEESCIHCGGNIGHPGPRSIVQRLATRTAFLLNRAQQPWVQPHGNWIHVLFSRTESLAR